MVKPIWILLEQETVSGSDISRAICKSAPRSRQTTTPTPHHSFFTGRMPFLPPNQQCQSTEGISCLRCLLQWRKAYLSKVFRTKFGCFPLDAIMSTTLCLCHIHSLKTLYKGIYYCCVLFYDIFVSGLVSCCYKLFCPILLLLYCCYLYLTLH